VPLQPGNYIFQTERFSNLPYKVLLLGEDSPSIVHNITRELDHALPNSRFIVRPALQHIAIDTAPDLFSREVLAFLGEPG
jgi:hypothetical protein